MTGPVAVIGVGNEWRRDDGAGLLVARAARPLLPAGVTVHELDGEPARLLDAWDGAALAVVVDAVRTGAPPGTVHHVDPASLAACARSGRSTHAAGVAEAHRLGRALGRLPGRLVLVGIEAGDTGAGRTLTPEVAAAVARAADEVVAVVGAELVGERA